MVYISIHKIIDHSDFTARNPDSCGVHMLTAFASFLADSEGEEQDDGFLG